MGYLQLQMHQLSHPDATPQLKAGLVHGLMISSLHCANNVVLLAFSSDDLQLTLVWFAAEGEAAGVIIITTQSEAMVLSLERE